MFTSIYFVPFQVFREFFIHADSPKRLRRGDSSIIRYRIFNYLYQPLSVSRTLCSYMTMNFNVFLYT